MRLIIAEKPSLGRAIAAAIPGQHRRTRLHIECANGDVVAWCAGHVLEMAPPQDYSAALERWTLETLPIVPTIWKHRVTASELVAAIRRLLAKAERVVHAGDPDREGQLLVDEVLLHLGWRGPTDRLLITDLSLDAVRAKLKALEPNERYRPLYEAALARQRADWLYGLNLTRLCTLRARLGGYRDVVSVGRVQTPVLGLIVRRGREIDNFVSKPFFGVEALLRTSTGVVLKAVWAVGKELAAALDPDGRLLDRELAARTAARVAGKVGRVTQHEENPHAEEAPLPYSLATLQIDASRQLGLSAARVLEVAQRLYERQLVTYPRSDCSYLPDAHRQQARGVLDAVAAHAPALEQARSMVDLSRRSRAWNGGKVTAHHGIIPTATAGSGVHLDETERSLYELVARRYVQQFMPEFEYVQTRVEIDIGGERFMARGRRTVGRGWRELQPRGSEPDEAAPEEREAAADDIVVPPLAVGESLVCAGARVLEKRTQPPKPFTDASLIQAMIQVAKYVTDPQARQILVGTDGIGTPATRAEIIERLFKRGYVERRKKQIRSTPVGRALIAALPAVATRPDMTAVWESHLARVQDRQLSLERFIAAVQGQLGELVERGKAAGPLVLPKLLRTGARSGAASPRPRKGARQRRSAPGVTRRGAARA
jgi:DNA topoisomerase III